MEFSIDRDVTDLVAAAAAGDAQAWEAIVQLYAGLVWAVVRAHGISPDDAARISEIVWLRLVEDLGRIEQPAHLGAWLAVVARNECLRLLRTPLRQAS